MTTLCVDIGNSRIKCARVDRGRVVRLVTLPSSAGSAAIGAALARASGRAAVSRVVVASVRPAATPRVVRAARAEIGLEALLVGHRVRLPMEIAVRGAHRLGADRICAAAGAVRRRADAIVVDAGSAITVDLVVDGVFRGGVILPGPGMALAALHAFTARLPDLPLPPRAPARIDDTRSAMGWGAWLATGGGIRSAVEMLEARSGRRPPRWITGGHAAFLRPRLPGRWRLDPALVLRGMDAIARLNPPA
jgi:type III pantothenate kinase